MDRRSLLVASLAMVAIPRRTGAQTPGKIYRIGFLGITDPSSWASQIGALRQGLRELGYEEGKNIVIEFRWANADYASLPKLAAELVSLNVDVLVTHGTPGSRAAKEVTSAIPIVIAAAGDPVQSGLVASLARPGGNITGNSIVEFDLTSKRFELLKEFAPGASHVGLLFGPGTQTEAGAQAAQRRINESASSLGIRVSRFAIQESSDVARAFAAMKREQIDALVVSLDALLVSNYAEIARLAIQYRIPTCGGARQFIAAGGLFSYGVDVDSAYRHAAVYIDKIVKGAKPADLPIEQPTKVEFLINQKTARAMGVTIPQSLLFRADDVIN
ncbi:MAG TPA: ABC transporter substrate-binding protein [Casimicrobiaceae bacterium]|nr:ABC transporter substrate-binding protein [Casimicrobiaceae bacterium]